MNDCLFCKIIAGELPTTKLYEDDQVIAILDIMPVNPGHALVIPKTHSERMLETSEEEGAQVLSVAKRIGKALLETNLADGVTLSANNGEASGQTVFHTHMHVIPRLNGDGLVSWKHGEYEDGEADKIATIVKNQLT